MGSQMFLFDRFRTGRLLYNKQGLAQPEPVWNYKLPSYPLKSPESTLVMDEEQNIYFGSHDACFYSLTYEGKLRWFFRATGKIYSSPLIYNDIVCFADVNGHLFGFSLQGNLLWHVDLTASHRKTLSKAGKLWDLAKRKWKNQFSSPNNLWDAKCWSSPNVDDNGVLYMTGYGKGLHAIDIHTGQVKWERDLGKPRNHLSGVAINEENEIFAAAQEKQIVCYKPDGTLKWNFRTKAGYEGWSNPSIDPERQLVYVPVSRSHQSAVVYALDYTGKLKWEAVLPTGTKGTAAVSYDRYILIAGLDGLLYFLDKENGRIIRKLTLGCAQNGLWTTASIDQNGYLFITTKESADQQPNKQVGSIVCLTRDGEVVWKHRIGKGHSTPVIDDQGRLYAGSWTGELICIQT
ncbi:hypothetical protein EBB07_06095 [Paenibacillaceae bacterium]|nr:hypothetical protein EBB07_06095 [Paenibacillaceae bacterium]